MVYRWIRDLHLYFGLFISPFILLFAGSVFYLNHGKLLPAFSSAETFQAFTFQKDSIVSRARKPWISPRRSCRKSRSPERSVFSDMSLRIVI